MEESKTNDSLSAKLELSDIIDTVTSLFEEKNFKILGFKTDERNQLRDVIDANGGKITNKSNADYVIIHESFNGPTKKTFESNGTMRTTQWLFNCLHRNTIIDDSNDLDHLKRSSDVAFTNEHKTKRMADDYSTDSFINDRTTINRESGCNESTSVDDLLVESELVIRDKINITLPNIFENVIVKFSCDLSRNDINELKRFTIAFGGIVKWGLDDTITHYIADSNNDIAIVHEIAPQAKVVKKEWLYLSINQKKLLNVDEFIWN
ncbi:BRCT domain-containing protein [Entamoeba marina]